MRDNKCAQIFANDFGWLCSFPMKLNSEAHEALFLLFHWNGVPSAIICDNAKMMIQGKFNKKLKEVSLHFRQTRQFTPWSNATEREMKEPKKVLG